MTLEDNRDSSPEVNALLQNIKAAMPQLKAMRDECSTQWGYEDAVYRFYHQSRKVYEAQYMTLAIVELLKEMFPERPLNDWFMAIVAEGTGKEWQPEDNDRWLEATRPIIEAFSHARYFLEVAVKYGQAFEYAPRMMPTGWAALLYLYNLR